MGGGRVRHRVLRRTDAGGSDGGGPQPLLLRCCCPHPPNPRFAGLPSDRVLPDDPTCRPIIERYAADQQAFFNDFAAAYVRLTMLGARWA